MVLAGYYRSFIKKFSQIPYPITSLHKKGNKFEWIEECATCFQQEKQFLTNAPVLKIQDPEKEFLVYTNDYKRAIGGVLIHEGHVVCYESRKLNEKKKNYLTHDFELEVIIHALKMWRHYLLSRQFIMMSDHSGLNYLGNQPNMNSIQANGWTRSMSLNFI